MLKVGGQQFCCKAERIARQRERIYSGNGKFVEFLMQLVISAGFRLSLFSLSDSNCGWFNISPNNEVRIFVMSYT